MHTHAKKILIILSSAVLICAVLLIIFINPNVKNVLIPVTPEAPPPTFQPAPPNIEVPKQGEKISNHDVGTPVAVAPSTTTPGAVVKTFAVRAFNNTYDPNTIIVRDGDIVKINFTAVDKAYDLTIPELKLEVNAKKGETNSLEFQATPPGKYLFYCNLCGGITSSTRGYLIIASKSQ